MAGIFLEVMKVNLRGLLVGIFLFTSANAEIKLEDTWVKGDYVYILVTYTNTTNETFNTLVDIKCTAYREGEIKVGINNRSFFALEYGPITPGFSDALEIPINHRGHKVKSVGCTFTSR